MNCIRIDSTSRLYPKEHRVRCSVPNEVRYRVPIVKTKDMKTGRIRYYGSLVHVFLRVLRFAIT